MVLGGSRSASRWSRCARDRSSIIGATSHEWPAADPAVRMRWRLAQTTSHLAISARRSSSVPLRNAATLPALVVPSGGRSQDLGVLKVDQAAVGASDVAGCVNYCPARGHPFGGQFGLGAAMGR